MVFFSTICSYFNILFSPWDLPKRHTCIMLPDIFWYAKKAVPIFRHSLPTVLSQNETNCEIKLRSGKVVWGGYCMWKLRSHRKQRFRSEAFQTKAFFVRFITFCRQRPNLAVFQETLLFFLTVSVQTNLLILLKVFINSFSSSFSGNTAIFSYCKRSN